MAATGAGKSGGKSRSGAARGRAGQSQAGQSRAGQAGKGASARSRAGSAAKAAKSASEAMPPEAASRTTASGAMSGRQRQTRQTGARQTGGAKAARDTSASRAPRSASAKAAAKAAPATRSAASRTARPAARRSKDALAFLKQDHRTVEALFKQFEEATDGRTRSSLMRRIAQALTVHAQIEEEILYPAARQELEDHDLLNEAQVEHDSAKKLIAEIEQMRPSEQLYKAKVTVLKEYVKHHVKEEERELFPLLKKCDLDLEAMGEELANRHQELMKGSSAARSRARRTGAETGMQLRG